MRLVADFAFSFRTAASAARSRCSGEQFQRCDVGWGHRTEMTLIEGGYFSESKPFSGGDHGGVGDAKGNPMYCRISFGCASQICRGDLDLVKVASHEGLYEVDLGRRANVLADQVTRLGYDVGCHEQIVCAGFQQSRTSSMVSIVAVQVGDKGSGINYQHRLVRAQR